MLWYIKIISFILIGMHDGFQNWNNGKEKINKNN